MEDLHVKWITCNQLSEFVKNLDLLPNIMSYKHLSITEDKYFSMFDIDTKYFRLPLVNSIMQLSSFLEKRKALFLDFDKEETARRDSEETARLEKEKPEKGHGNEPEKIFPREGSVHYNYLEYFLEKNGVTHEYLKFMINSKLSNLTIS
jgi:hypothetical protein